MSEGQPIRDFRDLRVWRSAKDLVVAVYRLTQPFPKHEIYGLTSQMQRAAVSVPSNIAEGHAREHLKEYLNQVSIARGSLAELQTQIEIAARLGYIDEDQRQPTMEHALVLGRQLSALRNALNKSSKEAPNPGP